MIEQGHRAVLLFAVLHQGINTVSAASHIDKKYSDLLNHAIKKGVEVYAYKASITPSEVTLSEKVAFK